MITVGKLIEFLEDYNLDSEVIIENVGEIKHIGIEVPENPTENYKVVIGHISHYTGDCE